MVQERLANPEVTLGANGATWTAKATPITNSAAVEAVVDESCEKYGADEVTQYYSKLDVTVRVPLR